MPHTAQLKLQKIHWEAIKHHIDQTPTVEVCGLIGGVWQPYDRVAVAYSSVPIPNVDPQPTLRYRMSPKHQLKTMLLFMRQGWEVIGIYHSHTDGQAVPSPTDIAEATYSDAIYLIGVPYGELRGWRILRGRVEEVHLEITP